LQSFSGLDIKTEGAAQALEYDLSQYAVFGVSNSGKTSELIHLFEQLNEQKHSALFGLTAHQNTPLENLSCLTHILSCGMENSVAATISVVEQALFFEHLLCKLNQSEDPDLAELSEKFETALSVSIPGSFIDKLINAEIIYFAGRNNGVAEELTLKTNEIIRKRSDFLEGTYAVHGIEEVMDQKDVLILVDPFEQEEKKFQQYLAKGVGLEIISISTRQGIFPTILIPEMKNYNPYLHLAAGWNLLVECGIKLDIDMDKPQRARKIGNEFVTIT
jgi:glucosamine--fructose-6-phosphate aminotransferase (isomerizing)